LVLFSILKERKIVAEEFRDGDDWPHNALAAIKAE
jgi:hypothetical protein